MSRRRWHTWGWIGVFALAASAVWIESAASAPDSSSVTQRLLGPLARPLASAQWVRVDLALRAGRTDLALARAETAIELDPGLSLGWISLARHVAFELASPETEVDPQRRLTWRRAALALAARGERTASDPGLLAFWQGLILFHAAQVDPELPWPGGRPAVLQAAVAHFERAATLGDPDAPDAARAARSLLRER